MLIQFTEIGGKMRAKMRAQSLVQSPMLKPDTDLIFHSLIILYHSDSMLY